MIPQKFGEMKGRVALARCMTDQNDPAAGRDGLGERIGTA